MSACPRRVRKIGRRRVEDETPDMEVKIGEIWIRRITESKAWCKERVGRHAVFWRGAGNALLPMELRKMVVQRLVRILTRESRLYTEREETEAKGSGKVENNWGKLAWRNERTLGLNIPQQ